MKRLLRLFLLIAVCSACILPASALEPEDTVGSLSIQLRSILEDDPEYEQCQLGELTALALREQWGTDIAVVPAEMIRNDLPVGTITWGDVCNSVDETQRVVTAEITPAELYGLLEGGFSRLTADLENETLLGEESAFSGYPQISGLYVKVDGSAQPGERVYEIRTDDDTKLDRDDTVTTLTIAAAESILDGTYGYTAEVENLTVRDTAAEALADYLGTEGRETITGNRVQIIGLAGNTIVSHFSRWTLLAIVAVICVLMMLLKSRYQRAKREFLPMTEGETRRRY